MGDANFRNLIRQHITWFISEAPSGRKEVVCRDHGCESWAMYERAGHTHSQVIGMEVSETKIVWRKLSPKPPRRLKFMTENRV